MSPPKAPAYLVHGHDPTLVVDALAGVVDDLVGDLDRSLLVDEFATEDYELGAVVDAAQTPPFLGDRRVVVARGAARFSSADAVAPLVDYLREPLDTTTVVVVWEKSGEQRQVPRVPKSLAAAVADAGGTDVDASVPSGRRRVRWFDDQFRDGPVDLDAEARSLVVERIADDVARLPSLLAMLDSAYGPGAQLGPADVEPFLGSSGSVPPWELTDAIDQGDITLALDRLHRMTVAGDRHSLQVMATLHSHIGRIARLDGADAADEKAAAKLLGLKGSTFPARKALEASRRLGFERIRRAVTLLAEADLDLRGRRAWSEELTMEVLVARLAQLNRR